LSQRREVGWNSLDVATTSKQIFFVRYNKTAREKNVLEMERNQRVESRWTNKCYSLDKRNVLEIERNQRG